MLLDIENYRAKRVKALESLARRLAKNVLKTRRNVTLEPMRRMSAALSIPRCSRWTALHPFRRDRPQRKVVITYEGGEALQAAVLISPDTRRSLEMFTA